MKAKDIQELIDFISKTGLEEVNIETEEFKIKVKRSNDAPQIVEQVARPQVSAPAPAPATLAPANPAPTAAPTPSAAPAPAADSTKNYVEVKSPMIGTFYRMPNPDAPAFVQIGDKVTAGQVVCIVEAMKLFNEIESEVTGTIVKVLVENANPVEYDQPLFLVDPS